MFEKLTTNILSFFVTIFLSFCIDFVMTETQTRCINCGCSRPNGLVRRVTVGTLDFDEKHLLQRWIPYLEVCDKHWICRPCAKELRSAQANMDVDTEDPPRRYGHLAVCISCGASVAKKRTMSLNCVNYQQFIDAAFKELPNYLKGIPLEKLCYRCYIGRFRQQSKVNTQKTLLEREMCLLEASAKSKHIILPLGQSCKKVERIRLEGYKHVHGGDGCIAGRSGGTACGGGVRGAALRRRWAAAARGVYLPHSVRLCAAHRDHPPPTTVQCGHLFTGEEIADLLFLLKCVPSFAEGRADPHWCRVWLGVPPAALRSAARRLRAAAAHRDDVTDPATAAAAYFLKNRHTECDTVLASLLECEPAQVPVLARIAAECLQTPHNGDAEIANGVNNSDEVNTLPNESDTINNPGVIEDNNS